MKLHRFFVGDLALEEDFWLRDAARFHQWSKVLRFEIGRQITLFNVSGQENLYQIADYDSDKSVRVQFVRELEPSFPKTEVYLCFALLKKDKSEWVLQKATELGVSHFVPLLTDRTEKTGFDEDRARKIVIEAAEQCGRTDIPTTRGPQALRDVLDELEAKAVICVAEQGAGGMATSDNKKPYAIFIGPEGGWSDAEKQLFSELSVQHISLSPFTLRAETAAIVAASKL